MNVPRLRFKEFSDEWKSKPISEALVIGSGKDYKHLAFGNIPVFGTGGLMATVNDFLHDGETVCIGRKGTIDKPMYFNGKLWTVDTLFYTHSFKEVLPIFIFNLFQRINWKEHNEASGVPSLSKSTIEKINLNVPSLEEQTKIANFLSAVDEKIAQLTQKGDLLARYKKGVMQQIFSQQLRFKDDEGRDFPEWEIKMLSDVNIYISDGNYGEQYPKAEELKQSGVPFIRANNINGLSLSWADMKFIDHSLHKVLTSGHLETNDILVTTRGDIGMVAYVNDEFHGANINAQICLLRVIDKSKLNTRYLLQLLSSTYCQKQFKELQTGSALKQLPKKNLTQIEILYPVISEQTKIANFLTALDEKISHNQTQLNAMKQYKQGLLQQMFV